jgi:putative oxidoreductase
MTPLIALHNRAARALTALAPILLPTLARLTFAAVLLGYFWASARTKLGESLLTPSDGAYAQIFPRALEAAGYDSSQLGLWPYLVTLAGTYAEFILPALIIVGLLTRLAALGMIGFIALQSLTDIVGHKAGTDTIGHWFDRAPDALILDQRAFWILTLATLVTLGAGPLALDRLFGKWRPIADV